MPVYTYQCDACDTETEMVHSMKECDDAHPCEKCSAPMHRVFVPVAVKPPPDMHWEMENNGRGRLIEQFVGKYGVGDPRNKRYFRSQRELIETAKREGYEVQRLR